MLWQGSQMRWTGSRCSIRQPPRSKWRTLQHCKNFPKPECPNIQIHLPRHTCPKTWSIKNRLFLLSETFMVTHLPDYCGTDVVKNAGTRMGKRYEIGNADLCIVSRIYSCLYTWMTSNWLKGSKNSILCARNWWNCLIWRNRHRFLTMNEYLECAQRECESNESFFDSYRKMFESRISAGATEK